MLEKSFGKVGNEKAEATILMEMDQFPALLAKYLPATLREPKEFGEWLVSDAFKNRGGLKQ